MVMQDLLDVFWGEGLQTGSSRAERVLTAGYLQPAPGGLAGRVRAGISECAQVGRARLDGGRPSGACACFCYSRGAIMIE